MKGIFINYRREDSIGYAGRIYDRLSAHFGRERVFMDIDTISPGDDFRHAIETTCDSSAVVLALIAKSWATLSDKSGRRRLENPSDFVRLELSRALAKDVRVIPVLLDDAEMPDPDLLPDDLKELAYRHAVQVSSLRFHHDVDRLIGAVEKALAKTPAESNMIERPIPQSWTADRELAAPPSLSSDAPGVTPRPSGVSPEAQDTRKPTGQQNVSRDPKRTTRQAPRKLSKRDGRRKAEATAITTNDEPVNDAPGTEMRARERDVTSSRATPSDDREHQRLAALYASMSDSELEKIASDDASLTDIARQALAYEIEFRHASSSEDPSLLIAKAGRGEGGSLPSTWAVAKKTFWITIVAVAIIVLVIIWDAKSL